MRKREILLLAVTLAALVLMCALTLGERPAALQSAEPDSDRSAAAESEPSLVLHWGGSVDLNTATAEELTLLPGVGEVLAGRIVAWREENGPFVTLEDLLNVEGVGEATLSRLYEMEGP